MVNKETNIWSTRDLLLASTLVTLGFINTGISIQYEGTKQKPIGYFEFEESDDLLAARREFNQNLVRIEPRMLWNSLTNLKAEISNMDQNPTNNRRF